MSIVRITITYVFSTLRKRTTTVNINTESYGHQSFFIKLPRSDHHPETKGVRIAFQDGFYMRWHQLMTKPFDENALMTNLKEVLFVIR